MGYTVSFLQQPSLHFREQNFTFSDLLHSYSLNSAFEGMKSKWIQMCVR